MLILLSACIGLQTVPDEGPGFTGKDPTRDTSGEPLDTAGDGNSAPFADAGGNVSGSVGVVLNLDGGGSYDPDGDALNYTWTIEDAPSGSHVALASADEEVAQLVPDVAGAWQISLVVDDGAEDSDADVITVTAGEGNGGPVAAAGSDQTVSVGASVTLDGTGSSDPDHDPLQYTWSLTTRPSGSAAALSSSTAPRPSFSADVAGVYEATLVVSDGAETSAPDRVRVVAQESGGGGGSSSSCGCAAGSPADAGLVVLGAWALVRSRRARRA